MRAPAGASVHAGVLILVNARHAYCGSEKAEALRPLPSSVGQVLLHAYAAEALDRLMGSLRGWEQITAVSGWRSAQEQQEIYTHSLHTRGRAFTEQFVALPGCSEHQTGLAVDLALKKDPIDFICPDFPYTGICQTFRQRAAAYGFIQRYPSGKEHVTGIAHEPWHFRYVGTPHAEIMVQNGLVLEEYIAFLRRFP